MVKKRTLTAVDIGTTKVCTAIASIESDGIELLGTGWVPSRGIRRGVIVNLAETVDCVKASLGMAEKRARTVSESAFVSVGGAYARGLNTSGSSEVRGKFDEIGEEDVGRAVREAQALDIPENSRLIHVLKRSYRVDGQEGISDPVGMIGQSLTAHVHLVLNASTVVNNIVSAINKAGVRVEAVVMQQLASGEATLSEDEKELGVVVVDIGGGTTDIAFYRQGSICHTESVPMGGDMITQDIAIGLKCRLSRAEELKRSTASVRERAADDEEIFEVGDVGGGAPRMLSARLLSQITRARCDEILKAVHEALPAAQLDNELITGVVLTGGGALLDGLVERAEEQLGQPVRTGLPLKVVAGRDPASHPAYCTALGLLRYAQKIHTENRDTDFLPPVVPPFGRGAGKRVRNWIAQRFA